MNNFDRRLRQRKEICGVTRKRMFKSPNAAMRFVFGLGKECNAPNMRAYYCYRCGGYHLTSQEYNSSRRYADFKRHQQRK